MSDEKRLKDKIREQDTSIKALFSNFHQLLDQLKNIDPEAIRSDVQYIVDLYHNHRDSLTNEEIALVQEIIKKSQRIEQKYGSILKKNG